MAITDRVEIKIVKIHSNGRIQIPSEVRKELGLKDGDNIKWCKHRLGFVFIERVRKEPIGVRFGAPV